MRIRLPFVPKSGKKGQGIALSEASISTVFSDTYSDSYGDERGKI